MFAAWNYYSQELLSRFVDAPPQDWWHGIGRDAPGGRNLSDRQQPVVVGLSQSHHCYFCVAVRICVGDHSRRGYVESNQACVAAIFIISTHRETFPGRPERGQLHVSSGR